MALEKHRGWESQAMKRTLRRAVLVLVAGLAAFIAAAHLVEYARRPPKLAYVVYCVSIDGRSMPVVDVRPTARNSTLLGTRKTLREVADQLHVKQPNPLVVQPGLGATVYMERRHFARTAKLAGKDLVICADMSDKFKWPWESGDLRMVAIDESVSRRLERLVAAINQEWGHTPDAVLESQATRLMVPGGVGSMTLADWDAKGKLDASFKLNHVVCVAVPLRGCEIGTQLRHRIGSVLSFTTPSLTGFVAGEPLVGEPHVEIRQRDGSAIRHRYLFGERLPDGSANPIPELTAKYLKGSTQSELQKEADRLQENK